VQRQNKSTSARRRISVRGFFSISVIAGTLSLIGLLGSCRKDGHDASPPVIDSPGTSSTSQPVPLAMPLATLNPDGFTLHDTELGTTQTGQLFRRRFSFTPNTQGALLVHGLSFHGDCKDETPSNFELRIARFDNAGLLTELAPARPGTALNLASGMPHELWIDVRTNSECARAVASFRVRWFPFGEDTDETPEYPQDTMPQTPQTPSTPVTPTPAPTSTPTPTMSPLPPPVTCDAGQTLPPARGPGASLAIQWIRESGGRCREEFIWRAVAHLRRDPARGCRMNDIEVATVEMPNSRTIKVVELSDNSRRNLAWITLGSVVTASEVGDLAQKVASGEVIKLTADETCSERQRDVQLISGPEALLMFAGDPR